MRFSYPIHKKPETQAPCKSLDRAAQESTTAIPDSKTNPNQVTYSHSGSSPTTHSESAQIRVQTSQEQNGKSDFLDSSPNRKQLKVNAVQDYISREIKHRKASHTKIGDSLDVPDDSARIKFEQRLNNGFDLDSSLEEIITALKTPHQLVLETLTESDAKLLKEKLDKYLETNPNPQIAATLADSTIVNPSPHNFAEQIKNKQLIITPGASVDFTTRMAIATPGTGLSFALAKVALDRYEQGEKILIFASHEDGQRKIAQAILDFAEPNLRAELRANLQVLPGSKAKPDTAITIVSPGYMKHFENRAALKLEDTDCILVDDIHSYIRPRTGRTYGSTLEHTIRETNSSKTKPKELITFSSTPADIRKQEEDDTDNLISRKTFQPDENAKVLEARYGKLNRSMSNGLLRFHEPPILMSGLFTDVSKSPQKAITDLLKDTTSENNLCQTLATWYKKQAIKPGGRQKKFEIWTSTSEAARNLTQVFTDNGIRAAAIAEGKASLIGSMQRALIAYPEQQDPELGDFYNTPIEQRRILEEFDKPDGEFSVLVHCGELLKGHNSPQTEGIIIADSITDPAKLLRAIAACSSKLGKDDNRKAQIVCLDPATAKIIREDLGNHDIQSSTLKSVKPTGHRRTRRPEANEPDDSPPKIDFSQSAFVEGNDTWVYDYLLPSLDSIYTDLNTAEQFLTAYQTILNEYLTNNATGLSSAELENIALGITINPHEFRNFANWFIANHGAFELDELITDIPNMVGIENQAEAELVTNSVYKTMTIDSSDEAWLAVLDQAIGTSPGSELEDRSRTIAKFGYQVLGEEYFTHPSSTEYLINIATGARNNPAIFSQLVNYLGLDLEQVEVDFPGHIIGEGIEFDRLGELIRAKCPDGTNGDLEDFFRNQLPELGFSYSMLVRASGLGANTREIKQILKRDLQQFLYENFTQAMANDDYGNDEQHYSRKIAIDDIPKASSARVETLIDEEPIHEIGQRLIYAQLVDRIWHQDVEAEKLSSNKFEYQIAARSIEIKSKNPLMGETISPKIFAQGDFKWLQKLNYALGGSSMEEAALNYEQRELINASMQEFLETKPQEIDKLTPVVGYNESGLTLIGDNKDRDYLCGILAGDVQDPEEQALFRAYVNWLEARTKLQTNEIIKRFPKLTGIENTQEARLALVHNYPGDFPNDQEIEASKIDEALNNSGLDTETLLARGWIQNKNSKQFQVPIAMFARLFPEINADSNGTEFYLSGNDPKKQEQIQTAIHQSEILKLMGKEPEACHTQEASLTTNLNGSCRLHINLIAANDQVKLEFERDGQTTQAANYFRRTTDGHMLWYEMPIDAEDLLEASCIRSASYATNNFALELRERFVNILNQGTIAECNQDWFNHLDASYGPRIFYNLVLDFIGDNIASIKQHDWTLEKAMLILIGHEPSIPLQTGDKISPEQEFFRSFVEFLRRSNPDTDLSIPLSPNSAAETKLMGIKDADELRVVVHGQFPNFASLNKEFETRVARNPYLLT